MAVYRQYKYIAVLADVNWGGNGEGRKEGRKEGRREGG